MRLASVATFFAILFFAVPLHAEMWQYLGSDGSQHFTNDRSTIPPEARKNARRFVPKQITEEVAPPKAADRSEILKKRLEIIAGFSEAQAEEAFEKGILTEEEVTYLVEKGALRLSGAAASYRSAGAPQPKSAPGAPSQMGTMEAQSLADLQNLAQGPTQVSAFKAFLADLRASPKFKWSLMGEGILVALLIVALPFILRNYKDDGTRRIIKASFFFMFLIISATANMVLFKDEVVQLLSFKQQAMAPAKNGGEVTPAKVRPASAPAATRQWDHNRY